MTKKKAMETEQLDQPRINPGGREKIYQDLDAAE
jgi:hypothetical protein